MPDGVLFPCPKSEIIFPLVGNPFCTTLKRQCFLHVKVLPLLQPEQTLVWGTCSAEVARSDSSHILSSLCPPSQELLVWAPPWLGGTDERREIRIWKCLTWQRQLWDNIGNAGYTVTSSFLHKILSSASQCGLVPLLDFFGEKCRPSSAAWMWVKSQSWGNLFPQYFVWSHRWFGALPLWIAWNWDHQLTLVCPGESQFCHWKSWILDTP